MTNLYLRKLFHNLEYHSSLYNIKMESTDRKFSVMIVQFTY